MSGKVKDFLDIISKNCGFDYSVNEEAIETVAKNSALRDMPTIIINQKTGMIGSPELTEIGANVTTFLKPDLKLARRIKIESLSEKVNVGNQFFRKINKTVTNNTYRVEKVKHSGDTHTDLWQSEITGRLL